MVNGGASGRAYRTDLLADFHLDRAGGVYVMRHCLHPIYVVEKQVLDNSDVLESIARHD